MNFDANDDLPAWPSFIFFISAYRVKKTTAEGIVFVEFQAGQTVNQHEKDSRVTYLAPFHSLRSSTHAKLLRVD